MDEVDGYLFCSGPGASLSVAKESRWPERTQYRARVAVVSARAGTLPFSTAALCRDFFSCLYDASGCCLQEPAKTWLDSLEGKKDGQ